MTLSAATTKADPAGRRGPSAVRADPDREDRRRLRTIARRLYSEDLETRFEAARELGVFARSHPDLVRRSWYRIFSAADDTMSCWGAAEGLGEIARNVPALRGRILGVLRKFSRDESSCQGYIWALTRIARADPEQRRELLPEITGFLDAREPCLLGQALWALGELRVRTAAPKIRAFVADSRKTWLYRNHSVSIRTIGEIARRALEKLREAPH